MKRVEFWKWMVRDEITGKMRKTRHLMDEETALARHPEATKVPGSMEPRMLPEFDGEIPAMMTPPARPNGPK